MTSKPKILAFAGSLRKDSFNKKLVKIGVKGAEEAGGRVTYIDIKDYPLPVYDQEIEEAQGIPENAIKLKKLFLDHDGFLISCPEYNSSMPAAFKNLIDWVSRPASPDEVYLSPFIDKVVVIMSASPGAFGGYRSLIHVRSMFTNIFSIVLPKQKSISSADKAFDDAGNLKDPNQQKEIMNLGKLLVDFLMTCKNS
jgi:NAD(P)H-dependent FMN reductase